jgi:hypothetical protein
MPASVAESGCLSSRGRILLWSNRDGLVARGQQSPFGNALTTQH